jgi:lipopolysaccharide cholinephosphotransferase
MILEVGMQILVGNENEVMDPRTIRSVQMAELDIVKIVDRLCSKHHLNYYLIGGSALGAVRHGGFIPWDDDVDIGMPRDDYQKFLQICEKELPEGLFLQTRQTDPNFFYSYAKIRNNKTTFIEYEVRNLKINHGIFIDIFPIDGAPDSKLMRNIHATAIRYTLLIGYRYFLIEEANSFFKKATSSFFLWFPLNFWLRISDWLLGWKRLKKARYWGNLLGRTGYKKEVMPRESFGEPVRKNFEGIALPIPNHVDCYLKHIYGNYMELPPLEKRICHNVFKVDLENSYLVHSPWASKD